MKRKGIMSPSSRQRLGNVVTGRIHRESVYGNPAPATKEQKKNYTRGATTAWYKQHPHPFKNSRKYPGYCDRCTYVKSNRQHGGG